VQMRDNIKIYLGETVCEIMDLFYRFSKSISSGMLYTVMNLHML
jgi:hypothetical protein